MATLPLTVRKGIRDAEAKQKEAIAEIEAEFGLSGVQFIVDYAALYAALPEDNKANVVNIVEAYLAKWVPNLKWYGVLKDDMNRQAILKQWTSKKIIFRINPKTENYCEAVIEGGDMYFQCKADTFYCNVDNLGSKVPKGAQLSQWPLEMERNLRDYDAKRKENLEKIDAALGVSGFQIEIVDMPKVAKVAADRGYENRLAEVVYDWYLSGLAENLTKMCADDMVKEAVRDAISTKKISFRVDPKAEGYVQVKFEAGVLAIIVKPENLASNASETGAEIEKLL